VHVLDDSEVERALVVTAHPDDVDFGAAGTVASWTAAGIEVTYCVCTDGDAGGFDPAVDRSEIPGIRRAEQIEAAKQVGVHDVRFLGYHDGSLTPTIELRRDISRVIRQVRPQRAIIQSPDRNWARIGASHPDHLASGAAAIAAIYPDARNPFAHPELLRDEGLEEWTVLETWVAAHPQNNHWVDITDQFDAKLAALLAHRSQTGHVAGFEERMRGWFGSNAEPAGLAEGRLAEGFWVLATA
jgi:LmbE family N-acetylglucosaminyl deacetylase